METKNILIDKGAAHYASFWIIFVSLCFVNVLGVPCNPKCTVCDSDSTGHVIKVVCTGVDIPSIPDSVEEMYLSEGTVSLPGIFKDYVFIGKTDLRVIHLKKYNITMVWESPFINLTNLVEVDLSFNSIPAFDKSNLAGPLALQILNLNHNNIGRINNNAFDNQTSLKELHMSTNKVTRIPANAFNGLTNLEHIDLSYNLLTTIASQAFSNCRSLKSVTLRGNRLTTVAPHLFQGLSHLQSLNLQRNLIVSIGQDALVGTNLTFLDLSRNRLHDVRSTVIVLRNLSGENVEVILTANHLNTSYGPGIFSGVTLKLLDLRYNGISLLPQDTFANNHIQSLNLSHNNLNSLPSSMETYFRLVKPYITLNNNPWQCDCKLLWFSKYLHQLSPPDFGTRLQSTLQCSGPANVQNRFIQDVATIIEPGCLTTLAIPTTNVQTTQTATVMVTKAAPSASVPVVRPTSAGLVPPALGPSGNQPIVASTTVANQPTVTSTTAANQPSVASIAAAYQPTVASTAAGNMQSSVASASNGHNPTAVPNGIAPGGVALFPGGNSPGAGAPSLGGGNKPVPVAQKTAATTAGLSSDATTPGSKLNTGQSKGQRTADDSDSSFPIGAVVGPLVALILIGGAIGWFLIRKKSRENKGRITSHEVHEPEETDYLWDRPFPVSRSLGPSKAHFNINTLKSLNSYQSC
ncbi:carboxypeptidase N subunit 2-like [Argopecten irradians]|uniref:carboxypeptidase N subunit 2-like n=1 Tax=Argopecten irradians TaxID=31199 RepID=UPI003719D868